MLTSQTTLMALVLSGALPALAQAQATQKEEPRAPGIVQLAQMQGGGMRQGQGMGRGMMRGGATTGQMGAQFGMIDADGNGSVSGAELLAWRDMVFDAMNADGDDALTREEFMAVQMGQGADPSQRGPRYAEMQAAKAAEFDAMDNNGDGTITREQFTDGAAAMFLEADADGDGALTPSEFRGMHGGPSRAQP